MRINKETIFHYVCEECNNWWSYATSEAYEPSAMFCPHCGHYNIFENQQDEEG